MRRFLAHEACQQAKQFSYYHANPHSIRNSDRNNHWLSMSVATTVAAIVAMTVTVSVALTEMGAVYATMTDIDFVSGTPRSLPWALVVVSVTRPKNTLFYW